VLLGIFLFIWLYRMGQALKDFDPLFIIPLLQSNYILFSTITGGIYFQEFKSMTGYKLPIFFLGIVVMFSGLGLLAPTGSDVEDDPEYNTKLKDADEMQPDGDPARDYQLSGSEHGDADDGELADPAICDDEDVAIGILGDVLGPADDGTVNGKPEDRPVIDLPDVPSTNAVEISVLDSVVCLPPASSTPQTAPRPRGPSDGGGGTSISSTSSREPRPGVQFHSAESGMTAPTRDRTNTATSSVTSRSSGAAPMWRQNSGTSWPVRSSTAGGAGGTAGRSSVADRRKSTAERASVRGRVTSTAMPEPGVFAVMDVFATLRPQNTGVSHPNAQGRNTQTFNTAPVGQRASAAPARHSALGVGLKPEAIELASRMDLSMGRALDTNNV